MYDTSIQKHIKIPTYAFISHSIGMIIKNFFHVWLNAYWYHVSVFETWVPIGRYTYIYEKIYRDNKKSHFIRQRKKKLRHLDVTGQKFESYEALLRKIYMPHLYTLRYTMKWHWNVIGRYVWKKLYLVSYTKFHLFFV